MSDQEKITRKKFNNLKKYYDVSWDSAGHTLHVGLFNNLDLSLEESYQRATDYLHQRLTSVSPIDSDSKILDVGCGTGRTLIELCLKYGGSGVGVDLSDEQIEDAKQYLKNLNIKLKKENRPLVKIRFIRGSGSELERILPKSEQFTHVVSQDALFLVVNKQSLFNNLFRLLKPGGAIAIADFLSENKQENLTSREQELIYKLVNWNEGLSFTDYKKILGIVGFKTIKAECYSEDMIKTYSLLADRMKDFEKQEDKTFSELKDRYQNIVSAVKGEKMGWAMFFAQKPNRPQVLMTGTKEKSISRYLGNVLHSLGWEVWLYSRNGKKKDSKYWHERSCDISSKKSIDRLLIEIKDLDLVMMLADSGTGHGTLEELGEPEVKNFISAKLTGSILLNKALATRYSFREEPIKLVWCAGKPSKKPKHLILYSMVNSGLASYVEEVNDHYANIFEAYYLPTTLISPSTLGDEYIAKNGPEAKKMAEHPQKIVDQVLAILDNKIKPGMIEAKTKIL